MNCEIVITGIAGRFPESDNVAEFAEHLYNKVCLLTEDDRRWEPGLYGLPRRMGMLKDLSKFDTHFFGIHHKQAHHLDPQSRMLLESTYESIVDAGYDPVELRGRNIGVYVGNCSSECNEIFTMDPKEISGYTMSGCCSSMFPNRISYTFDFKGPSLKIDTACSSSALGLYEAVQAINDGKIEAAIVGGANLCVKACTSLQFYGLNMLSDDGLCKAFDAAADGYGRSEAVATIFVQKAEAARRKYATIVNIKTNTDGYKADGITFPSFEMQRRLIAEVFEESQIDPLEVSYVEAHGTGTPAGDPIEMSAIVDVICKGRNESLLVGTVKSNMGHPEPTSGLCGIIKILIGMENGLIPPNILFKEPNPEIPSLLDGRIKIVTESTPWNGGYATMSCFGFGGVNVHALLKSNSTELESKSVKDQLIPQLALYNGRTEESVETMFDYFDENEVPREFFALLHQSVRSSLLLKPYRGYKVLTGKSPVADIKQQTPAKRPLWYIFSGMGTQWPGMAKQLMNLELFADSIKRSAKVLKSYGLNLIDLVTNGERNSTNSRSIISAFVSIAAVQVALVDVLNELGLKPDGIIGHSVGELGCAYADGCFTAEQMILSAYWRGKAVEDSKLEEGAMAAIGITWSDAKKRCPKDVYPSCHNAEDSVTVSGPKKSISTFVDSLKAENVFAREVDSCGYAFHSHYIFPAASRLQTALEKVIPNPTPRSCKWISSSYPESEWNNPDSKTSSAKYFVHNLISPVLFHEALRHVPQNAIVLEIAPHHLLQAILKRVVGPEAEYIGLMKRHVDTTVHLLTSIGRLYTSGLDPDVEKLYPPVQFPVPRGVPMIAPLIKWDHSETWTVAKWDKNTMQSLRIIKVNVGPEDSPDHFILGHCIDGRYLYPAAGYIVLVWRAFAESRNMEMTDLPIKFENVKFHRATILSKTATTKFIVAIADVGGDFEISEGRMTVCTGRLYTPEEHARVGYSEKIGKTLELKLSDIYQELKLRGYDYGPTFQGIISADVVGTNGLLKWDGNWIVFLDLMLQFTILGKKQRGLYLPTHIQSLVIDPAVHMKVAEKILKESDGLPIRHEKFTGQSFCGGVEIKYLKATLSPRQPDKQVPLLEQYKFISYDEPSSLTESQQALYEEYNKVCSTMSKKILKLSGKNKYQITDIMNGMKEADDLLISNYTKAYADNHVLLKSLCDIINTTSSKNFNRQVEDHVISYLSNREDDILSQTLITEISLRTIVDIVLENVSSKKLKVAEAIDHGQPMSSNIYEFIQTFGFLKVNYSIAHPNPSTFDKEKLPPNSEVVNWDIESDFGFKDVDLFVIKYLTCSKAELKKILHNAVSTLKPGGFILVLQRTRLVPAEMILSAVGEKVFPTYSGQELEQNFKDLNLITISKRSDSLTSTMYLLRRSPDIIYKDSVIHITAEKYDKWVDQLRDKMMQVSEFPEQERVWLISEDFNHSGIIGLVNCLRQESGGSCIRCVLTEKNSSSDPDFGLFKIFYQDLAQKDLVMNVLKGGTWGSYRHVRYEEDLTRVQTEHAYLKVLTRGDLSSLVWVDSPLKYFTPSDNEILCQVYYSSLNFRDIMLASGKLPPDAIPGHLALKDSILGLEFSGRTMEGRRVMGILSHQGMATTVAADPFFLWDVPDKWTLEEAATVTVAYSTAYYAIISRGNLKPGKSILIHSGSGGVGQAAIAIALSMGCEVFTTVGTPEKKEYLKKRFPQLKDENFCNSRDTSFEQCILKETKGRGVDAVLNSLADDKLKASLNCLAVHGRFLEIGKYDLANNTPLGMSCFLKDVSFHGILLDSFLEDKNLKQEVMELVKKGIADGVVKPLNIILFNHDQTEQAYRYMASGRHIGKVVIKIKDEEPQKMIKPTPVRFSATTRTAFDPRKSYVIIGGLGGFGLELCQWMVDRGAEHVVLTSRSGIRDGYQRLCLSRWKEEGANVIVSKLNATYFDEANELLQLANKYGEIGGIFNLALVLRDALMENQTLQNYLDVCASKVETTRNLDLLSRKLCPELDWFVCFSSVSCGRGNAGQTNYGYANSVMERICEARFKEGLPGLAIQWGAIGDVGVLQNRASPASEIGGTVPQRIMSCLSVLDKFLHQRHPVVSSVVPFQPSDASSQKESKHHVLSTVANIFGIKNISLINPETSLGELGMDSLMGFELKQYLERDFELVLSIPELRSFTIKDLKTLEGESEGRISTDNELEAEVGVEKIPGHYNTLGSDKLVPSETVVHMNSSTVGSPIFILHPIEGTVTILESLAQVLPCPVYGIQCTPDAPSDSIEGLAAWYWKKIKSLSINKPIHLVGYSFGGSLAFEMALQAEKDPKTHPSVGSLIMLDGSPALVTSYTREHESHFMQDSQVEGEVQALFLFAYLFSEKIDVQKKELLGLESFAERVHSTAEKIASSFPHLLVKDLEKAFDMFYKKLDMSLKYTPKKKYKSDILLIKASESVAMSEKASDLYDLDNFCDGKITSRVVKGTHSSFIQDKGAKEVSKFISEVLRSHS